VPVLDVSGPLTVKEVESLVFVAARANPRIEPSQRTWLEADRSYFIRARDEGPDAPPRVIGLVHAFQLPEMACRVTITPFAGEPTPALLAYAGQLRAELEQEGFR
jgi:hypothetical protein